MQVMADIFYQEMTLRSGILFLFEYPLCDTAQTKSGMVLDLETPLLEFLSFIPTTWIKQAIIQNIKD